MMHRKVSKIFLLVFLLMLPYQPNVEAQKSNISISEILSEDRISNALNELRNNNYKMYEYLEGKRNGKPKLNYEENIRVYEKLKKYSGDTREFDHYNYVIERIREINMIEKANGDIEKLVGDLIFYTSAARFILAEASLSNGVYPSTSEVKGGKELFDSIGDNDWMKLGINSRINRAKTRMSKNFGEFVKSINE